jgi:hypothetical protein
MRNLKKYLALALSMAMMLTAIPGFAAESFMNEDKAQDLNAFGLYAGLSQEEFEPALERKVNREEAAAMVVRLFGVTLSNEDEVLPSEEEALEIVEEKFKDADQISGWAVRHVAYGVENGYINGYPDETFKPKGELVGRAFCTMILANLDYEVVYEEAGNQFAEAAALYDDSIIELYNSNSGITRDVLVGITYDALDAYSANEDTNVAAMLVEKGAVDQAVFTEKNIPMTKNGEVLVVDGTEPTPTETPDELGAATAMTEVKVTGDKTLLATFDGTVSEEAVFTVTGPMTVNATVTWNEGMTEATLTNTAMYLEGVYTVKVVDGEFTAEKTVNVVANGIANIEILDDKVVRTSETGNFDDDGIQGTGFFYVKLTDSYGNDVTKAKAYDVTITLSKDTDGELSIDGDTGKVDITLEDENWDDYPAVPEIVTATIYSNTVAGGVLASTSKVLTVTELSRVQTIELGEVTFPGSNTQILTDKDPAAYVEIVAKDQFGYEVTDADRLQDDVEIVYSISDSDVDVTADEYTDADGVDKVRLEVETVGLDSAKVVTLSAISKYKGQVSNTVSLDVRVPKAVEKVTLGGAEKVMAVGDTYDEVLVLPFMAYDIDGKELTTDEVVSAYNAGNIVPSISGYEDEITVEIATSGENKGKIVSNLNDTTDDTTHVAGTLGTLDRSQITLKVDLEESKTMPTVTKLLSIKDRAYAASIEFDTAPATKLLAGAITKFNFKFFDQYGREMDADMLAYEGAGAGDDEYPTAVKLVATIPADSDSTFDHIVNVTVDDGVAVDKVANAVVANPATLQDDGTPTLAEKTVYVTAESLTEDNAVWFNAETEDETVRLEATLYKEYDLSSSIDTLSNSFTIADGMPSDLTYEIQDVPTLFAYDIEGSDANKDDMDIDDMDDTTAFDLLTADEASHARALEVLAKDASGNTFAIPQANILSIKSSDTDVAYVVKATDDADLDAHRNNVVVFGVNTAFNNETLPSSATKTATITLSIATDDGAVDVSKTVTVSNEPSKAAEVVFVDDTNDADDVYNLAGDPVTDLAGDAADINAEPVYLYELDQYGVYSLVDNQLLTVVNTNKCNQTNVTVFSGGLNLIASSFLADEKVYLMYTADSGAKGQFSVTVTDGEDTAVVALEVVPPTIDSIETQDLDANGQIDAIKVTFTEDILDSTVTVADFDVAGYVGEAFSSTTNSDVANDDVIYITFTESGAADTDATPATTYTLGDLTDLAGNALATAAGVASTDAAAPVLLSATLTDAGGAGVDTDYDEAGDEIAFVFSEAIDLVSDNLAGLHDLIGTGATGETALGLTADTVAGDGTDTITVTEVGDDDSIVAGTAFNVINANSAADQGAGTLAPVDNDTAPTLQ